MNKRIIAALVALVMLSALTAAAGLTWQTFTWNGYTIEMKEIQTPDTVAGQFYPGEGQYFVQVALTVPQEVINNGELIDALNAATRLYLPDGTLLNNAIRMTTDDGVYAAIFTVGSGLMVDDLEFLITGAEAVETLPLVQEDREGEYGEHGNETYEYEDGMYDDSQYDDSEYDEESSYSESSDKDDSRDSESSDDGEHDDGHDDEEDDD